jgi:hypothetical protein
MVWKRSCVDLSPRARGSAPPSEIEKLIVLFKRRIVVVVVVVVEDVLGECAHKKIFSHKKTFFLLNYNKG